MTITDDKYSTNDTKSLINFSRCVCLSNLYVVLSIYLPKIKVVVVWRQVLLFRVSNRMNSSVTIITDFVLFFGSTEPD